MFKTFLQKELILNSMLVLHFKLYIIYFEQYKNKKVNLGVIWPYLKSRNKETLTAKSHSEYK